ncbi:MAG: endonuclease/exonuclease/phosphatase family protein, partial [Actinomycetota bacterium]|nr:endonuclease/exonuclease/phosphatase family protein [Actinomycetota bacterium]
MEDERTGDGPGAWKVWLSWTLVAPAILWAVVRALGLEDGFPMVQLIAYTPYVLVLALLVCLAVVLLRQWLPFAAGLLAVVALGVAVVPRELGGPDEVAGGQTVRI